jgi:hypothetical protein
MTSEWAACHIPGYEQRLNERGHLETRPAPECRKAVNAAFLEALIKRSAEAEEILQDCGRIRFQRALQAAVELYVEQSTGWTNQQGGQ